MTNEQSTSIARAARLREFARDCYDPFSAILSGWKDYYLKPATGAPRACVLCASGQGRFAFGDIRKGYGRPA